MRSVGGAPTASRYDGHRIRASETRLQGYRDSRHAVAYSTSAGNLYLFVIVTFGTIVLSAVAARYCRWSVLQRQGPWRGVRGRPRPAPSWR